MGGNDPGSQHWAIGEVARRTGLSVHALRFYERRGLLPQAVHRGPDGHRSYSDADIEWLEVCVKLRASGMPLAEIRRYTHLVSAGSGNEPERLDVLEQHRRRVLTQMAQLNECLELITLKVKLYQASVATGGADPVAPRPPR